MSDHTCNAIVVTCIDFRFQRFIEPWLAKTFGEENYDRVAWAGGVFDLDGVLKQIDISSRLHAIKTVALVNHEDCGAYGPTGTPEKHAEDLKAAKEKVLAAHPDLTVDLYYLHLDGTFETVS